MRTITDSMHTRAERFTAPDDYYGLFLRNCTTGFLYVKDSTGIVKAKTQEAKVQINKDG